MSEPVAAVTVRYWAGARHAAGVEQDVVEAATLAEALAAALSRHDAVLARVLGVCSFVVNEEPVGKRAHGEVRLADGDVVEVLPPFAGGAAAAEAAASASPFWGVTGLAVLSGVLLALGAVTGEEAVWLVAVVLQLPLVVGWHRSLGVTAAGSGMLVGAAVATLADVTVWVVDDVTLAPLAGVVAATFLLGAAQQLARRDGREGLTASLAATTTLGALVASMALWPVLTRLPDGEAVTVTAGLAVAGASLGRSVRAVPVAGVMVPSLGFVSGLVLGGLLDGLTVPVGAALGLVVSLPVLVADLLDRRDPRLTVNTWPAAAVWPFALAAPLAYLVARIAG